jgi:pre-mRNA-splicing factor 18
VRALADLVLAMTCTQSLLPFPPTKARSPDPSTAPAADAATGADDDAATELIASSSTTMAAARPEAFNISPAEAVRRLRQKGQPIRLFGEDDKDRRLRLRALELMEERGGAAGGGLNDFKKALEDMQAGMDEKEQHKKSSKTAGEGPSKAAIGVGMGMGEGGVIDLGLLKTDPDKLYPLIYYAIKVGVLTPAAAYSSCRP